MNKAQKKMAAEMKYMTEVETDSLTRELEMNKNYSTALIKLWKKILLEYEDSALKNQLMFYRTSLTKQMHFKDKLIEKLLNEYNELNEFRSRNSQNTIEMVHNSLIKFKKEIEAIQDQYWFQIQEALPKNLAELEVRANENSDFWKQIKYINSVIQLKNQKKKSKIERKHIESTDLQNGKHKSIIDKFLLNDMTYHRNLNSTYSTTLEEYKENSEELMENYLKLKEDYDNDFILQKKLKKRAKEISNTISQLEKKMQQDDSFKEVNKLTKERDELQKRLVDLTKQEENSNKNEQKKLSLLRENSKKVYDEMNNVLQLGIKLKSRIILCEKLETPEEKLNVFPIRDMTDNVSWPLELEKLTNFWQRVKYIRQSSKCVDEKIHMLKKENNKLKKKHCLDTKKMT